MNCAEVCELDDLKKSLIDLFPDITEAVPAGLKSYLQSWGKWYWNHKAEVDCTFGSSRAFFIFVALLYHVQLNWLVRHQDCDQAGNGIT